MKPPLAENLSGLVYQLELEQTMSESYGKSALYLRLLLFNSVYLSDKHGLLEKLIQHL
jgi:hypothetical protein